MRKPFNTTCSIFAGPGTGTPGLLRGNFNCRFVVEDGIHSIGVGCPSIPAYLTLQGYEPRGGWTFPYFGMDSTLCDRVAIPAGTIPVYWVLYTDVIIWGIQAPYFRAYLVSLPAPPPSPVGGILLGGSALVVTIPPFIGGGGIVLNGSATVSFTPPFVAPGGILLGGSAAVVTVPPFVSRGGVLIGGDTSGSVSRTRLFKGSGGVLLGGAASWSFTPGTTVYWEDTFTDPNFTNITAHTGETTPGGYTIVTGSAYILSNMLANNATAYSLSFDPGQTSYTAQVVVQWDTLATQFRFRFRFNNAFDHWSVTIFISGGNATGFTLEHVSFGGFSGTGTFAMSAGSQYTILLVVTPTTVSATIGTATVSTTDSSDGTFSGMGYVGVSSASGSVFSEYILV